jgi:hypothetical protein
MNTFFNPNKKNYTTIIVGLLFIAINIKLVSATPPCQIVTQSFQNSADGAKSDNGTYGWSISPTTISGATYWAIQSKRFKAQELGTEGVWSSKVMNISGYPNFQIGVKITAEGTLTSSEYVKIYYKLNGGAETLMSQQTGNFGTQDLSSGLLNASTVQIVIRIKNTKKSGVGVQSIYYIEEYRLFSDVVGCSLKVTPTANGTKTCANPSVTLSPGINTTSNVTYQWSGPGGFTSTSQNPVISTSGTYNVTATIAASSSTATGSVNVSQNTTAPGATAGENGTLTCTTGSVALSGSSGTSGVTYAWMGPGSFSSGLQNPSVSLPGSYILTVTNPVNGCTSTSSTTVPQNIAAPGATANVSGPLTCTTSSVTLLGNSGTSGVTYSWSGSNGLKSALQNPTVSAVGIDTLKVTNPVNGCKSTASVTVTQNKTVPGATAGVVGTLTCSNSSVTLTGSSGTSGVNFSWTGPNGFSSVLQNPSVSAPGIYTLTVTNPVNGCYSIASATVSQNISAPSVLATGASLPCSGSVVITGAATIPNAGFNWAGPNGFTSTLQNPIVNATGVYTFTVTDPSNGCSASDTAIVVQGIAIPGVTASVNGNLTCATSSVTLSGSAGISGVNYSWSGPNGFSSNLQNSDASFPGTYTLTVSNSGNGCTSIVTITVSQDLVAPGATASVSGSLTCKSSSVTLLGSSGTSGVTYSWTGPDNFSSSLQNPSASAIGTYTLTVANLVNGCISTTPVMVTEDKTAPGATAGESGQLTCVSTSVALSGSSLVSGVTYSWTGPNGFTSILQNPGVSVAGSYTLTVSSLANGCTSSATTSVPQNLTAPIALATVGGILTCSNTPIALAGSSNTFGANFNWSGPNGFVSSLQNPLVIFPGNYILTATDPANGCSSKDTVTVSQNISVPGVIATGGILTCTTTSIIIKGNSDTLGVTYNWSGPNSFASTLQNPTVSIPGAYIVKVTNPVNGCTSTATAFVTQNTNKPGAIANGGSLTCTKYSVTLSGNSGTSGVSYRWTGPNGFASTLQNPIVDQVGTYSLTVLNPDNGCISNATANVIKDTIAPGAMADVSGPLGCTNPTVTLLGNSATIGVTYSWTGPNSFSSNLQNPSVSNPGTYILTTTNQTNGCTSNAAVTVVQNSVAPGASAGGGGTITCAYPSLMLSGSSSTLGVTYKWAGPNSYTSTLQNPTVTAGGLYTLTVTNPINGCTSTATVNVAKNTTAPGATAGGGVLTCTATAVSLSGSSPTPDVTYSWSGPGSFTSTLQNPTVNAIGTYTLTVTNPVNGCTSTATTSVTQNITAPGASAVGGNLTCTANSVTLGGSSGTLGVIYSWTGPNSFASNLQNPTVNTLENYVLTVTNPINGCTSTATTSVTQNTSTPGATAGGGGTLTCTTTSVALSASSGTSGVTYSWKGPNGFVSSLQNPTVSVAGVYNLKVTNPVNNCTSTAMVNVLQNSIKPGVKASSIGTLTCATTSVSLTATSATPNTTFAWGGYTAGQNPVSTIYPGKYLVTATNPVNGCKSIDSVAVNQVASQTAYQFVYNNFSSYANGTLSDNNTSNGWYLDRSQVPNASNIYVSNISPYFAIHSHRVEAVQIGGQGIWYTQVMNVAGKPDFQIGIKVTSEGTLNSDEYVKLYYKVDGGSETLWDQRTGYFGTIDFRSPVLNANTVQIVVKIKNYGKGGIIVSNYYVEEEQLYIGGCGGTLQVYPAVSGNITCANPSVTLSATSSHSGATFQWTGPNGFTSSQQYPVVSMAGTYNVTATILPSSTATGSISVAQNMTAPGASASVSDSLTCAKTYVTLSGSSSTSGVTYRWAGPNGFLSSMQNPALTAPGLYTLTVTNPVNGCTSNTSVNVVQNTTIPGVSVTVSDTLTCSRTSVTINVNFTNSGVTYSWTGPNGFTSTIQSPSVSVPGLYALTVTNVSTGCTSIATANVIQNTTAPDAMVAGGTLTCSNISVVLSGNSTTAGVTYSWAGPGNFTSSLKNPTVNTGGIYTLTVTNPVNGCTKKDSVTVTQDIAKPNLSIAPVDTLTNTTTSVSLDASSATPNATITWTGFANGQNPITVSAPGVYIVTAINNMTGCIKIDSVTVLQDIAQLDLSIAPVDTLTCMTTSVSLTALSTIPNTTFNWTGFANGQNPVSVSLPGKYIVTAINHTNGSLRKDSITVFQNIQHPDVSASVSDALTCNTTSVTLMGNSGVAGVTYRWSGPLNFASTEKNPVTTHSGSYTLVVKNPSNGCTSTSSIPVLQDTTTATGVNASISGNLTCTVNSVTLVGSSSTNGVTYSWTGPGGFSSTNQNIVVYTPGNYALHVGKPSNGCVVSTNVSVFRDTIKPKGVSISASGIISCTASNVVLTGSSSTSGVSYSWVGPGFASTGAAVSITNPGTYNLTVTNPVNNCITMTNINVIKDLTLPTEVTASVSGTLTCSNPNVTLSASSTTSGVVYTWSGPGGFSSNESAPHASNPGSYIVTVTNPYNNCSVSKSVDVLQNISVPEGVMASASGVITCSNPSVTLNSSSTTSGVSYNWAGPGGFTSTAQNPSVSVPGIYTLTVINSANGCSTIRTVEVNKNTTPPANVFASVSGDLNCINAFVTLIGSSSTVGAEYHWSGPAGFEATEDVAFAISPGLYSLTVTDPDNGCSDTSTVTVVLDNTKPVSNIIPPASSPVALTNNTLSAQVVNNVTYLWSFSSGNANWSIVSGANTSVLTYHAGDAGTNATYMLTVTSSQNGCSSTSQIVLSAISAKSALFDGETDKAMQIKAYPNPFSDKAMIEFTPVQDGHVAVELYTNQGDLVSVLFDGEVKGALSYKVSVDGSSMAAGAYYFLVRTDNKKEVYTHKVILIK